jgi:hypothetical protein
VKQQTLSLHVRPCCLVQRTMRTRTNRGRPTRNRWWRNFRRLPHRKARFAQRALSFLLFAIIAFLAQMLISGVLRMILHWPWAQRQGLHAIRYFFSGKYELQSRHPERPMLEHPSMPCCPAAEDLESFSKLCTADAESRIVQGLSLWITQCWQSTSAGHLAALQNRMPRHVNRLKLSTRRAVLNLAAVTVDLLLAKACSHDHVKSLAGVLQTLMAWIMPPSLHTKRTTQIDMDVLLFALSACRLLMLTSWQLNAGTRRRHSAILRMRPLAPGVHDALTSAPWLCKESRDAMYSFVSMQIWAPLDSAGKTTDAVLYQLANAKDQYIGMTKLLSQHPQCAGEAPCNRFYQHHVELRTGRVTRSVKLAEHMTNKFRCFQQTRMCDIMIWKLRQDTCAVIAAMEKLSIYTWKPSANDQGVGDTRSHRTRRHSKASREHRARPPYRRRQAADPASRKLAWESAATTEAAKTAARIAACDDQRLRENLFTLTYDNAYKKAQ